MRTEEQPQETTLSSLKYDEKKFVDETRQGVFIYGGDAARFHEWEFRTLLEISSCKKNDLPGKISEIVKALRGEAATIQWRSLVGVKNAYVFWLHFWDREFTFFGAATYLLCGRRSKCHAGGTHRDYTLCKTARHVAAQGVVSQALRRLGPAGSHQTPGVMTSVCLPTKSKNGTGPGEMERGSSQITCHTAKKR